MSFLEKIEQSLMGMSVMLDQIKHIKAIREGMISTIPLTIIGSFFLLIAFPPVPQEWFETVGFFRWIAQNRLSLLIPFRASMGMIAIFVVYNTSYNLAKLYKLDGVTAGTLSLVAFFITQDYPVAVVTGTAGENIPLGLVVPLSNLGSAGLFVGILTSFVSTEIFRFFKTRKFVITMPDGVPPAIVRSFEALYPMLAIMVLFGALHYGPRLINPDASYVNLHVLMSKAFFWLSSGLDTLFGALLLVFFICLLWITGIHGVSIIGAVARPIWLQLLDQNTAAYAAGQAPPHIFPEPFYQWFVWIGGSGATMGLVIVGLLFARSQFLRSLCKAAFIPSLFNINEPLIFGIPIVLNPILAIPFILAPMVMTVVTWFFIQTGLVPPNIILAPWTFPAPIGAYISSGGSIMAALLTLGNITLSCLIYLPFVLAYDKKMQEEELSSKED